MSPRLFSLLICTLFLAGCFSPAEIDRWTPKGEMIDSVKVQDFTLTASEGTSWTYSEHGVNTTLVIAFLFTPMSSSQRPSTGPDRSKGSSSLMISS